MLLDKGPRLFGLIACLVFAVNDLAVLDVFLCNDHGIADPFAVNFQDRDYLADKVFCLHLVGRPHLAGDTVPHGVFHAEEPGKKIGRPAHRR